MMASFTVVAPLPLTKRNKPNIIEILEKQMHKYIWTLNQLSWSTMVISFAEMTKYFAWEMTFFVWLARTTLMLSAMSHLAEVL